MMSGLSPACLAVQLPFLLSEDDPLIWRLRAMAAGELNPRSVVALAWREAAQDTQGDPDAQSKAIARLRALVG